MYVCVEYTHVYVINFLNIFFYIFFYIKLLGISCQPIIWREYGRQIQGASVRAGIATSTLPKNECLIPRHRRPNVFFFLTRKEETNFSQHSRTIIAIATVCWWTSIRGMNARDAEVETKIKRSWSPCASFGGIMCALRLLPVAITQVNCFWMIVLGHLCVRIFWMKLRSMVLWMDAIKFIIWRA